MTEKMNYTEVTIAVELQYQDIVISELMEIGFEGVEQEERLVRAYITSSLYLAEQRSALISICNGLPADCQIVSEKVIEPKNWNEEWEKTIEPVTVGKFFIKPSWKDISVPDDLILLEIDPKMAFGTGYHETTRLMLRMLGSTVDGGEEVLDIGTGTGVLSIAAIRLGAGHAFGFDIDEWSYDNASENSQRNRVSDRFKIREGSFETIPENKLYDMVLANVNRNMLLSTSYQIVSRVAPGGKLLLSGLLDVDEAAILQNRDYSGLQLVDKLQENEWICLKFKKGK